MPTQNSGHKLPKLIHVITQLGPFLCSGSDDEDGTPLSAKFAHIYPLNNYDDAEVVANMNGIHNELNGGGENMALKDEVEYFPWQHIPKFLHWSQWNFTECFLLQSPSVSSTSSSSSEADDEEADGESGGEQPDVPKEEIHVGKRSPRKDGVKMDSPPPSYLSPQV